MSPKSKERRRTARRFLLARPLTAAVGVLVLALGACSGSSGGESRLGGDGGEAAVSSTTRAPIIPPQAYDALRNAKDPNSFLTAFGAAGAQLQAIPPEALAAVAVAPAAIDFMNLVTRVQNGTYTVAYRVSGDMVADLPGETYLTIVHTPDAQKMSVRSGSLEAAEYRAGGQLVSCVKVLEWDCEPARPAGTEATGAEVLLSFLGLVIEQPGAFDTSTYRTQIVGVPVNCIRAQPVQAAADLGVVEVCVTAEGVPLRGTISDLSLEGVWYKPAADAGDLSAP